MSRQATYRTYEIDLTVARDNPRSFSIEGIGFQVLRADAEATVRIGGPTADPIPLEVGEYRAKGEGTQIGEIYVENPAALFVEEAKAIIAPISLSQGIEITSRGPTNTSGTRPVQRRGLEALTGFDVTLPAGHLGGTSPPDRIASEVILQARAANPSFVWVLGNADGTAFGQDESDAATAPDEGFRLQPGEHIKIHVSNLDRIIMQPDDISVDNHVHVLATVPKV